MSFRAPDVTIVSNFSDLDLPIMLPSKDEIKVEDVDLSAILDKGRTKIHIQKVNFIFLVSPENMEFQLSAIRLSHILKDQTDQCTIVGMLEMKDNIKILKTHKNVVYYIGHGRNSGEGEYPVATVKNEQWNLVKMFSQYRGMDILMIMDCCNVCPEFLKPKIVGMGQIDEALFDFTGFNWFSSSTADNFSWYTPGETTYFTESMIQTLSGASSTFNTFKHRLNDNLRSLYSTNHKLSPEVVLGNFKLPKRMREDDDPVSVDIDSLLYGDPVRKMSARKSLRQKGFTENEVDELISTVEEDMMPKKRLLHKYNRRANVNQ
jgi:hypothetical protein